MIIYGPSLSPFARKVLAFANEKGLTYEHRADVRPGSPDPAWRQISPTGKVPALEDGSFRLADSSAIVHYLEAKYPEPALIPADPEARGRTIWFDKYADTVLLGPVGKMFFNRVVGKLFGMPYDPAIADTAQAVELPPLLDYLETQIDGDFLVGGSVTLADIAVTTMLINAGHVGSSYAAYPKLDAYFTRMTARPSFAAIVAEERKTFAQG